MDDLDYKAYNEELLEQVAAQKEQLKILRAALEEIATGDDFYNVAKQALAEADALNETKG